MMITGTTTTRPRYRDWIFKYLSNLVCSVCHQGWCSVCFLAGVSCVVWWLQEGLCLLFNLFDKNCLLLQRVGLEDCILHHHRLPCGADLIWAARFITSLVSRWEKHGAWPGRTFWVTIYQTLELNFIDFKLNNEYTEEARDKNVNSKLQNIKF